MNQRINLNEIANVGDKSFFEKSGLTQYYNLKRIEFIEDVNNEKSKYSVIFKDTVKKPKDVIRNADKELRSNTGYKNASITYIEEDDEISENAHIVSIP